MCGTDLIYGEEMTRFQIPPSCSCVDTAIKYQICELKT